MMMLDLLQLEPPQCFGFRSPNPCGFLICVGMGIVWIEVAGPVLFLFVSLYLFGMARK